MTKALSAAERAHRDHYAASHRATIDGVPCRLGFAPPRNALPATPTSPAARAYYAGGVRLSFGGAPMRLERVYGAAHRAHLAKLGKAHLGQGLGARCERTLPLPWPEPSPIGSSSAIHPPRDGLQRAAIPAPPLPPDPPERALRPVSGDFPSPLETCDFFAKKTCVLGSVPLSKGQAVQSAEGNSPRHTQEREPSMTYLIHTAVLRAALFSAANDKVRYYLNGVHVGADGFICSTDGHRMFFGQLMDESARPAKDFIIPLGTLKKALAGHKAVTIEFDETRVMDQLYTPVDGHFPDWRRVVPAACTGETAQFNGAYLSDMEKVGELLCAVPVVHHNGGSPAGVSFTGRPDCGAVLMPMRREDAWAPVCHSADVLRSAAAALAPVEPEAFTPAEVAAIEAEAKVIAPQAEPEVTAARAKRARPIEPQTFNPPASIWADPEAEATIAPRRSKPAAQPVDMDRAAMLSARAHKAVATRRARAAARAAA